MGRPRSYKLNEYFFQEIDTEHKAYILGFIMADGCVSSNRDSISISIHRNDIKLLNLISNSMGSDRPIYLTTGQYSSEHEITLKCSVLFQSKILKQSLVDLGCVPNKSQILKFPTKVSHNLLRHFLRGYFDGDGTVFVAGQGDTLSVGIISTKEFCEGYLDGLSIAPRPKIHKEFRVKGNTYYFTITRKKVVIEVYEFLYKDATIFLERKKKKFDDYFLRKGSTTIIETPEMVMV